MSIQALDEGVSTLRVRRHSLNPSRRNLCAIWDDVAAYPSRVFSEKLRKRIDKNSLLLLVNVRKVALLLSRVSKN